MRKRNIAVVCGLLCIALCAGCESKKDSIAKTDIEDDPNIIFEQNIVEVEESDTEQSDIDVQNEAVQSGSTVDEPWDEGLSISDTDVSDSEKNMTKRDLFADFIMGKSDAMVSNDYVSEMVMSEIELKSGTSYSVPELKDLFEKNEAFSESDPEISYAPLRCHDELLYALKFRYDLVNETYEEYFILSEHSDELKIVFAIDGWTRRSIVINDAAVVFDSGSNGAGSHSSVVYAPDRSIVYKTVSDVDEQYVGYSFYDDNSEPIEALNATMEEAGAGNQAVMDVAFYREIIKGKSYFYYLGGVSKITQSTVDYIDGIAKKHDFIFDGKAAADEARDRYEEELDVVQECKSNAEPHWKTL